MAGCEYATAVSDFLRLTGNDGVYQNQFIDAALNAAVARVSCRERAHADTTMYNIKTRSFLYGRTTRRSGLKYHAHIVRSSHTSWWSISQTPCAPSPVCYLCLSPLPRAPPTRFNVRTSYLQDWRCISPPRGQDPYVFSTLCTSLCRAAGMLVQSKGLKSRHGAVDYQDIVRGDSRIWCVP